MDTTVLLTDKSGAMVGVTVALSGRATLPDVIVTEGSVFAYEDISDDGHAVYKVVTAYGFDAMVGKAFPWG